jgi:hypothetical protein
MMNLISKIWFVLCILSLCISCSEEKVNDNNPVTLTGQWDSYETGTEQGGFVKGVTTSLTIGYESGLSFFSNGTFKLRRYNSQNGLWTETDDAIGTFVLQAKTISLTYSPGTRDELHLDLHVVKLEKNYLWFTHNYFGKEVEYHLKRH